MGSNAWSTDERDEYEQICDAAWIAGDSTAARVEEFHRLLSDAANHAHRFFAEDALHDAVRVGLTQALNRWRKSQRRVAVSYEGQILSKPRVVGTRRVSDEGKAYDTQTLFDFMSWAEIEAKVADYLKQVSAYKSNIAYGLRLLELRELAPDAANPDEAARFIGVSLEDWLIESAA